MLTPQQRVAGLTPPLAKQLADASTKLRDGKIVEADRGITTLLARRPDHPEILRVFAAIQAARGQYDHAVGALQRAHAARPRDAVVLNALAGIYERTGHTDLARAALKQACDVDADFPAAWFNYAWRLYVDGDLDASVSALRHTLTLQPAHKQARTLLADALHAEGRADEARALYREIVAADPSASQAWWGLATLRPVAISDDDVATLRALTNAPSLSADDRVTASFALAIALESAGRIPEAFALMQRAHATMREREPYDAAAFSSAVDALLREPPVVNPSSRGAEVIFIVSMPRSGSTLVEQILAAHSHVAGAAELPDLGEVLRAESTRIGSEFPAWVSRQSDARWRELGEHYLQRTQRFHHDKPRFTDKMPANWMYIGAIMAMLPAARVVVVRRDPLETCLACYRYMFRRHPYTHVFDDLAARWHDFERATTQWQQRYPDRVRIQRYEALVADAETQTRDLLAFCSLPFEQACIDFHTSDRRVSTPSAAQVRQPLMRDTARAAKYGALLDPLRAALESRA
jgi:Flp pilus assembly protein TadD